MRLSPQPLLAQCFWDLRVLRRQSACLFKEPMEGETNLIEQTVSGKMISCGSVVLKLWRTAHNFFFNLETTRPIYYFAKFGH